MRFKTSQYDPSDHGSSAEYSPRPRQVEEGIMHLGVVHTIRDRAAWDAVVDGESEVPPGFELLGSVTQDDVSRAICIWDAPSLDALQRMLDEMLGAASVNDCFVADSARSINLPAPKTAPAPA
jgi:hypothetical protein